MAVQSQAAESIPSGSQVRSAPQNFGSNRSEDHQEGRSPSLLQWLTDFSASKLLPAGLLFFVLYNFFDRRILFNDEIVNLHKAQATYFFDYGSRPLYYAMNHYGVQWLGSHYFSLIFLSVLGFGATLYLMTRIYQALSPEGRIPVYALLTYPILCSLLVLGIQGMAHVLAGVLILFSLWSYLTAQRNSEAGKHQLFFLIASGVIGALAVVTHPTTVAFIASLSGVSGFNYLVWQARNWKEEGFRFGKFILSGVPGVAAALTILGVEWIAVNVFDNGYFKWWRYGIEKKLANPQLANRYDQPFTFYFDLVFVQHWEIFIFALLALGIAGFLFSKGKDREGTTELLSRSQVGTLFLVSLGSLIALSCVGWKFPRVLLAFTPVLALLLQSLIDIALQSVKNATGWNKGHQVLRCGLALGFLAVCIPYYTSAMDHLDRSNNNRKVGAASTFELLRNLPDKSIALLGTTKIYGHRMISFQIGSAEKTLAIPTELPIELGKESTTLKSDVAWSNFLAWMFERGVSSFAVPGDVIKSADKNLWRVLDSGCTAEMFQVERGFGLWRFTPGYRFERLKLVRALKNSGATSLGVVGAPRVAPYLTEHLGRLGSQIQVSGISGKAVASFPGKATPASLPKVVLAPEGAGVTSNFGAMYTPAGSFRVSKCLSSELQLFTLAGS